MFLSLFCSESNVLIARNPLCFPNIIMEDDIQATFIIHLRALLLI